MNEVSLKSTKAVLFEEVERLQNVLTTSKSEIEKLRTDVKINIDNVSKESNRFEEIVNSKSAEIHKHKLEINRLRDMIDNRNNEIKTLNGNIEHLKIENANKDVEIEQIFKAKDKVAKDLKSSESLSEHFKNANAGFKKTMDIKDKLITKQRNLVVIATAISFIAIGLYIFS